MPFAGICPFLRGGLMLNAVGAAVVSNVVGIGYGVLFHNRTVDVGGVNDVHIYLRNRGVVGEGSTSPLAAEEADSPEAESVVDSSVVADVVAPVAIMESVLSPFESPVGRCPQGTRVRCGHPCAGNPIVIPVVGSVAPVTWRPHQVWLGTRRLHIDRQHRRCKSNIDADTELGVEPHRYYRNE
jgi:hypothetical protein